MRQKRHLHALSYSYFLRRRIEYGRRTRSHGCRRTLCWWRYGTDTPTDEQKGIIKFDGKRTLDKESGIYYSGTIHEEQQPSHLKIPDLNICYTSCMEQYQNPCTRFCPANVYELEIDEATGKAAIKLNFSNCVHCKTCDIKDPCENITWVPPEGGGDPKYTIM
jgi:ferredoxin-like protein FixX